MHKPMISQCAATALALAVGGALRPPVPPLIPPPALKRRDEAAGLKAVLMRELCTIQPFVWTY